jgi:hypothetical protein
MKIPTLSMKRARTIALALLVLVAIGGATAWPHLRPPVLPETTKVALVPPDPPDDAVEIVGVDTNGVWADTESGDVIVKIHNRRERPVTAEVWWLLGGTEDPEPWNHPVSMAEPEKVSLDADETTEVRVRSADPPPPGSWNLSLWAHVRHGSESEHSHGVGTTPVIRVLSAYPDIERTLQPGAALINAVQPNGRLVERPGEDEPDVLVSVQALVLQPTEVEVRCYLTAEQTTEPWLAAVQIQSDPVPLTLDGTHAQMASCVFPALPPTGEWSLSAVAWRQSGMIPEPPEDAVRLKQVVTFGAMAPPLPR